MNDLDSPCKFCDLQTSDRNSWTNAKNRNPPISGDFLSLPLSIPILLNQSYSI